LKLSCNITRVQIQGIKEPLRDGSGKGVGTGALPLCLGHIAVLIRLIGLTIIVTPIAVIITLKHKTAEAPVSNQLG
jgi:hypothetical protein